MSALAARCLEVVTIHIPVFKAHFEERLPPKQYVLLSQFDQILKVMACSVIAFFIRLLNTITPIIIYMKKLLSSDWLR